MLNVNRLALLSELARSGTVHEVGRALSYSPSTVSQQLKVLEAEVGEKLVQRVGRGLVLTDEGRLLARHADRILAGIEEAETAVAAVRTTMSGTVRLATFQTAALSLLPTALDLLTASHPDIEVFVTHIDPARALPALEAREYDLVLGEEYPGRPVARNVGVVLRPLLRDPLVLVAPLDAPQGGVGELVARHPWVMEPAGNDARAWVTAMCRDLGVEPIAQYESPDLLVQLELVETGHAIAVLPALLLNRARRRVRRYRLPGEPSRAVFTGHRASSSGSAVIAAVREQLARAVASAEGEGRPRDVDE